MSARKSKPARSCPMCKPWKWYGNGKERRPHSDRKKLQKDKHESQS